MVMKTKLFLAGIAIMAATTMINAQSPQKKQGNGQGSTTGQCTGFVDANKDGICDLSGTKQGKPMRKNVRTTGTCNTSRTVHGSNFVDANKNGICDAYEVRTKK
jgi:hypothetical protein